MSADFTKILVKDDRLEVVDNIKYAVVKGGQNVTMAQFQAISASNNQLVFNIQVPSEQTIIDRRVLLQTDLTLVVTSTTVARASGGLVLTAAAPVFGCGYGSYAALAPYPLHQLMTVASATINNNTVSINIRDVLPFIIRALDKGDLNAYNSTTATAVDSFLRYTDGLGYPSNPNGAGFPTLTTDMSPRGSIALTGYTNVQNAGSTQTTETFTFHISEPLLLSPFIYCNPKSNAQGFYGIQNMNFVFNIGEPKRAFRGFDGVTGVNTSNPLLPVVEAGTYPDVIQPASPAGAPFPAGTTVFNSLPYITNVSYGGTTTAFSNTALLFTFLTPHPSDLMPARNIVPYYELPRYITNAKAPTALIPTVTAGNSILGYNINDGYLVPSQTLQLNQIPDKLIVFVRKTQSAMSYGDSDAFLPIRKITINFNNNSGILSSSRSEDLFRMSKNNGSNQQWNEWLGVVNTSTFPGTFNSVPTVGSCLMLEFGKDIQLVEDFFAPGSLGNFNIQLNVTVQNVNQSINLTDSNGLELVMITMNSGVFVCERGTSSTYTGILTRADVLEASEQDAYTHSDVKRMVGGGFLDMLKSGVSKLAPLMKAVAPIAKDYLGKKGAMGKLASQGISALGGGMSGCGPSGAGMSGGALRGRYM
jgi:hypothetical protein